MKKIILFFLLLLIVTSQRGGGSRSSSSRSSSRSRSYGRSYGTRRRSSSLWNWWGSSENSTAYNTTNDEGELENEESNYGGYIIIGAVSIFVALGIFSNQSEKKAEKIREQNFEDKIIKFEGEGEATMCTLTPEGMASSKDWFMSRKWNIKYVTNDNTFRDTAVVTLKDIKLRNTFSYNISFSMLDSIGGSEAKGTIMHQADYFSIIFRKIYDDKQKSGQTGTFQTLIYKGVQRGEMFVGEWYYEGHENSSSYTGTWQMTYDA